MPQTYLLSNNNTEVTTTPDGIIIKTLVYEKMLTSWFHRIKRFLGEYLFVFLFLITALVFAYFELNSVTIECQRQSADAEVICSVTKNHYLRSNELLLSNEPIKDIVTLSGSGSSHSDACRLDIITKSNSVISPLSSYLYSSGQCNFDSDLKPIKDLFITDHSGRSYPSDLMSTTISDNLFTLIIILAFSFIGIITFKSLLLEGFLTKTVFDSKQRKIIMSYVRLFDTYQKVYDFDEIRKVVFIDNTNTENAQQHPYLLSKDFKKIEFEIYGEAIDEKLHIIELVKKMLA